jgi:thiol-disulfide isomerase/thioredoxin
LVLQQNKDSLYGTILSETGDYRYLNGKVVENSAWLQSFDGGHTFRFDFEIAADSLKGNFIYGPKGSQEIKAKKADINHLKNAYSLTKLEANDKFGFTAINKQGKTVTESDQNLKGKGLIIQVLGSWCPNCLDETRFLVEAWKKKPANVEFIGLAFERKKDLGSAFERIDVVKNKLNVPYKIYWGGQANKDSALLKLRGIKNFKAFPTTIFVKPNGKIHKVHTGFSGPATGIYYEEWKKEFEILVSEISK